MLQILYIYFHQIEDVEFIHDNHRQTFLSTLYIFKLISDFTEINTTVRKCHLKMYYMARI